MKSNPLDPICDGSPIRTRKCSTVLWHLNCCYATKLGVRPVQDGGRISRRPAANRVSSLYMISMEKTLQVTWHRWLADRVAPECTLDDGAGRHIKVGRHVSLRPPPISLVYDTAELIGVDVCAWALYKFLWMIYAVWLYYSNIKC